jgi:hypothetical protein
MGGGKDGKSPIVIKKGGMVFGQVAVMHLREDIWGPDAGVWNPDRWATARPGAWVGYLHRPYSTTQAS